MVLAYCTTYYHLFNVIQLKLTLLDNEEVDLVLSSDSDFDLLAERLRTSGLFHDVFLSPVKNVVWSREYNEYPEGKRKTWFLEAVKKGHGLPLCGDYSDLYIGLDDPYNKFFYYCLVARGMQPTVHLYEEGTASYVLSVCGTRLKNDGIPHQEFSENQFALNISEMLVYAPEWCEGRNPFPVHQIPKIERSNPRIKDYFNGIFPYQHFPSQRYIYFEGGAFQDFLPTQDIEILDQLAAFIGKDQIVVKLHPRTTKDRFSRRGYYVMPQENVPWEVYALNEDLERRVYLSNASTAALTPHIIFGLTTPSINLFRLDLLEHSLYTRQKAFPAVYKMQEELLNQNRPRFFAPANEEELKNVLLYLNLE